ncbi:MAG TPA: enoyl-CoA hydratase/isomerase family protein [Usitatibacter sp.]|jgi:enoyl-CoA hydratase/carnithine racemase|nr:enoyl-CoA hydratase/isomerase family protein [Usitatibacter sp.]
MEEPLTAAGGELAATIRAGVATVTLNRPAALNALSYDMIRGLADWLDAWETDARVQTIVLRGAGEKAFCAGGDVRALHASITGRGNDVHRDYFEVEYALDFRIHTYPKPIAAIMDGIVMGGGMGLAQGAALRLVGERTRMAMPETAIGLFPDVGGSYFLSRCPGELGTYLGLVGPTIHAADAIYCGLADAYIGPAAPLEPALPALRPAIDRHFAHASVPAIAASLESESAPAWRDWAVRTREALGKRSPTMLAVTLEQLRRGARMPLEDCLRMELDLVRAAIAHGDLVEGIRAQIIEKDNQPRWNPATLEEVSRASVEGFFALSDPPGRHPLAHLGDSRANARVAARFARLP